MGGARPSYLHYISADVTGWTKLITRDHRPTPLTRSNVGQSHFLVEHSVPNNTLWQPYRHFKFYFLEETPVDLMINTRAGAGLAGCAAWPPILITGLSSPPQTHTARARAGDWRMTSGSRRSGQYDTSCALQCSLFHR